MDYPAKTPFGYFIGSLYLEVLDNGRDMKLTHPYGFIDALEKRWLVPSGAVVDGASIPRALWSIIGGPFEGKYRNSSVIHDYYCDTRSEPWKAVHRVFFDGMRASGVSERRAKLMYAAVYFGGPRWSISTVINSRLPRPDGPNIMFSEKVSAFELEVLNTIFDKESSALELLRSTNRRVSEDAQLDLVKLDNLLNAEDVTLDKIESALDRAISITNGYLFYEDADPSKNHSVRASEETTELLLEH